MTSNRNVLYVDFGYATAREMWEEVGLVAYQRFTGGQSRANAVEAAVHAWHIHEWAWHEANPGIDTQRNPAYRAFRDNLFTTCPELAWVRDIADAAKHRGLGRPADVQRVNPPVAGKALLLGGKLWSVGGGKILMAGGVGLTIELTDGSRHAVADVLANVIAFWQEYFEKASLQHPEQSP